MTRQVEAAERQTLRDEGCPAETYQIAIIGLGPKGLYCLDSLVRRMKRCSSKLSVRILIFEPAKAPGAGVIYDLRQPDYLRMNFPAGRINAWEEHSEASESEPSLVQWLSQTIPKIARDEAYVSRSVVGRYLNSCFQQIVKTVPNGVVVEHFTEAVTDVTRNKSGWTVSFNDQTRAVDEVMITVGHEGWRASQLERLTNDNVQQVISVFPTDRQLSEHRIPAGTRIAVRGFALTAIDAMLALTEGRGGRFECDETLAWHYQKSDREPARISPFSRTGRPMLAKPELQRLGSPIPPNSFWDDCRKSFQSFQSSASRLDYTEEIRPFIFHVAERSLAIARSGQKTQTSEEESVSDWWTEWIESEKDENDIYQLMADSYAVAMGQENVGPAWALGETWRQLYPVLVKLVSHLGLHRDSWMDFNDDATEFERLAFGPPAENLGRLLALIHADIVDLSLLGDSLRNISEQYDVLINAVIPAADCFSQKSVISKLLTSRQVERVPGAKGIYVSPRGFVLNRLGQEVSGLAILGRPTEGCILGNDTLSRSLHDHPAQWADVVLGNAILQHTSYSKSN